MKSFDYYKLKDELNKTCERLYAERESVEQKRADLESGKANLYHDNENAIKVLRTEEVHIQEVTSRLEEAVNELEWFTCE